MLLWVDSFIEFRREEATFDKVLAARPSVSCEHMPHHGPCMLNPDRQSGGPLTCSVPSALGKWFNVTFPNGPPGLRLQGLEPDSVVSSRFNDTSYAMCLFCFVFL